MIKAMKTERTELYIGAYIQEINTPPMEDAVVDMMLELAATNMFGAFKEMDIERKNKWKLIDYNAAKKHIYQKQETSVVLRSINPLGMSFSITKSKYYNTINLNLLPEHFQNRSYEDLFDFMYKTGCVFNMFNRANATADLFEINDFYFNNNLNYLPDCFGNMLSWFTLLSPATYSKYYKRTDLLAAPAYKIYEYEDGWLGIRAYDNPIAFTSQETAEQIVRLNDYLNKYRSQ